MAKRGRAAIVLLPSATRIRLALDPHSGDVVQRPSQHGRASPRPRRLVRLLAVSFAAMPARMPAKAAMPAVATMRNTVAPAVMFPMVMIPAIVPGAMSERAIERTVGESVVVTDRRRHATGKGKTGDDHERYRLLHYSAALHDLTHFRGSPK